MNKKTAAVLVGTAILPLGLVGCSEGSGKTHSYEVSGVVEAAHVDYECEGDLALEPAAFVVGGTKPKPGKANSGGGSHNSDDWNSKPENEKKQPAKKDVAASKAPTSKAPTGLDGVKLSKKPDEPERITEIKPPKYKHKPKGCYEEYELFVRNGNGLFEQDVRKVDYDKCSDRAREHFPVCTKD